MTLYRVLRNLKGKQDRIERDQVLTLNWDQPRLEKLLDLGLIAVVSPPPLSELPGWKVRARRLKKNCGIVDAEQFLEFDKSILRKCLGSREADEVQNLQDEVLTWLQPAKRKDCGC